MKFGKMKNKAESKRVVSLLTDCLSTHSVVFLSIIGMVGADNSQRVLSYFVSLLRLLYVMCFWLSPQLLITFVS